MLKRMSQTCLPSLALMYEVNNNGILAWTALRDEEYKNDGYFLCAFILPPRGEAADYTKYIHTTVAAAASCHIFQQLIRFVLVCTYMHKDGRHRILKR